MARGIKVNRQIWLDEEFRELTDGEKLAVFEAGMAGKSDHRFSADIIPFGFARGLRLPHKEWTVVRERIFARDNHTCVYCGARDCELECDHKHPVSRGGTHEDENLATACFPCNRAKGAKTLEEWKGAV